MDFILKLIRFKFDLFNTENELAEVEFELENNPNLDELEKASLQMKIAMLGLDIRKLKNNIESFNNAIQRINKYIEGNHPSMQWISININENEQGSLIIWPTLSRFIHNFLI